MMHTKAEMPPSQHTVPAHQDVHEIRIVTHNRLVVKSRLW